MKPVAVDDPRATFNRVPLMRLLDVRGEFSAGRARLVIETSASPSLPTVRESGHDLVSRPWPTSQRKVFGELLLVMQNTRFKLAECQTKAAVTRAYVDECVASLLGGTLDSSTSAMAKWWSTQVNCEIIDECLQLHGGYGYMTDYPIARMYTDARVGRILAGSNEVMKELIARGMEANLK